MSSFDPARFRPSPVAHVEVEDARLGYRTIGAGAPLVLVMGFAGTMAEWDPALVAALAESNRVIVFDNRGVATSTGPTGSVTIEQMADDTAGLIEALELGRAHVLGWSMGGEISQELAIRHPGKVDRVVLAATDAGGEHAVEPTDPRARAVLDRADLALDELLAAIFPRDRQDAARAYADRIGAWPDLDAESFAISDQVNRDQAIADHGPGWLGRGKGAYERLARVRAPTLVLHGEDDLLEPVENAHTIANRIPDARLKLYEHAGHAFLFQEPERVAADVRSFLAED